MATGSSAREIALAHSTASQPSSIASAASEAVPTPASRITGTLRALADQAQVVGVEQALAGADRGAERHHRGAADVLEPAGEDRVVVRVREDGEALVDELLGGLEQRGRVGQQRVLVADHLELDPVGLERLAGELGGEDRVAGGEAAGGVGEQLDAARGRARRRASRARRVDAAQRDGDELGAAGLDRGGHRVERAEAAGAEQQPAGQLAAADRERVLRQ